MFDIHHSSFTGSLSRKVPAPQSVTDREIAAKRIRPTGWSPGRETTPTQRGHGRLSVEELLTSMVRGGGSDLHLSAGARPMMRVDGKLYDTEFDVLNAEATRKLVYSVLDTEQIEQFETRKELDISFGIDGLGRFRTNVFLQCGTIAAVMRVIPFEVKPFRSLGLPVRVCEQIAGLKSGLVLCTGVSGSGKSTTLASIVDHINETRQGHIVTIEDPIEFLHSNKNCLVNQREVGADTGGFGNALRSVLRQDPDVVLVGEMRDLETIEAALTLAETGHLTLGTLHTSDTAQTINRIIDVFPAHQHQQIRTMLSATLQAVVCQQLLPKVQGKGRALAAEVMLVNPALRTLIRDSKTHQIGSVIQTCSALGMKTMNQSLYELYRAGTVSLEDAMAHSTDQGDLKRLMARSRAVTRRDSHRGKKPLR